MTHTARTVHNFVFFSFEFERLELQRNEDFTFDRIMKNYNKYFRGPKENETQYMYEEISCREKRD